MKVPESTFMPRETGITETRLKLNVTP